MKIQILNNKQMRITNVGQTQNENIVTDLEIDVPEKYKDFIKTICFIFPDGEKGYEVIGLNETYSIPLSVSKYNEVEFYIKLNKEEQCFITETRKIEFFENIEVVEELTPEQISDFNSILKILEEEITKVDNIDIDAVKEDNISTITITKKDGTKKSIEIRDGKNGIDGKDGINGKDGAPGLPGKDGKDGVDGLPGKDGVDGLPGKDGAPGKDGKDGLPGKDGIDGYTPIKGIDYFDGINGTNGKDGINGKDGVNGVDGKDGFSPVVEVTQAENGTTISITDKNGTKTANILNGKDGINGTNGKDGLNGKNGEDYILTEFDKNEIANIVYAMIPNAEEVEL